MSTFIFSRCIRAWSNSSILAIRFTNLRSIATGSSTRRPTSPNTPPLTTATFHFEGATGVAIMSQKRASSSSKEKKEVQAPRPSSRYAATLANRPNRRALTGHQHPPPLADEPGPAAPPGEDVYIVRLRACLSRRELGRVPRRGGACARGEGEARGRAGVSAWCDSGVF